MSALDFTGQTVVITGAGGGIGRVYSLFFAERGANVVVNDVSQENSQKVVDEIVKAGGKAVANNASVTDGELVIKTAIDTFGGVTILINNAGILRDGSFKKMTSQQWDAVQAVHLKGAFSCTKAAWPHFRKQKFGRVINTASAAGLYGNFGQANYSAAKAGLITFTQTLAIEGAKYGIHATAIAPMARSAMTESILPPHILENLKPEFVAPFILAVTHPDGVDANGKIYECGAGFIAEVRWERALGVVFKADESFTPAAVKERFEETSDWTDAEHPSGILDIDNEGHIQQAREVASNKQGEPIRYDGKTVIITGAGAGLGRAYARMFAKFGANVVVNDVSEKGANAVVDEIKAAGGKAVAAVASAEDGEGIVKTAIDAFGGVHILVANAGILRDKSFQAMTEAEWDAVMAVHMKGTFNCAQAVWPHFQAQKYGRIIVTSSGVGLYGNFGQANYSTAKGALIGFTRTLALEGKNRNILVNAIAPSAGTAMTKTVWPKELVEAMSPDYVAPFVGFLASEDNTETGGVWEVSGGWAARVRWQRAFGKAFSLKKKLTPELIIENFGAITDYENSTHPSTTGEAIMQLFENMSSSEGEEEADEENPHADPEDVEAVTEAKKHTETGEYTFEERDVILYNLGIGATAEERQWVFENDDDFGALPSFGVIPQFLTSSSLPMEFLPNFNPAKLLHGEQYLSIKKPIPTSGTLVSTARLLEVLDKGKAAAVTSITETREKNSGDLIFENQSTVFIRGSGGLGGRKTGKDRGNASAANKPPSRKPDAVVEETTNTNQAALYRLSGDYNPLHIQPEFAAIGGFDKPILHGLASLGFSGKHIVKTFGAYSDIKVRFAGVVYPGETLVTSMWKEGDKVIFETKTKDRNSIVLAAAAATLVDGSKSKL